ncbi:MAG: hypothetical protein KF708_20705 [Pirellulales bacterium]|nr:hypothetical protein [Pirellulales bacterium]
MRNPTRTIGFLLALAWVGWLIGSAHTHAAPPLSKGKDCICAPNSQSYGYYPARWRRWPGPHMHGMPTPAMLGPDGSYMEEMPELLPPANEQAPRRGPSLPTPASPTETLPADSTDTTPPSEAETAPPSTTTPPSAPPTRPSTKPAEPAAPTLPPVTLPDNPLAPPADLDDDPVPSLPQSMRETQGRNIPALAQMPRRTTTRAYIPPKQEPQGLDETGLPLLPGVSEANQGPIQIKTIPAETPPSDTAAPVEAVPELIEPAPSAQPLDNAAANKWTRHRENPLRGSGTSRDVQSAAHWQTPAPAAPAVKRPTATAPRSLPPAPATTLRSNPLR